MFALVDAFFKKQSANSNLNKILNQVVNKILFTMLKNADIK